MEERRKHAATLFRQGLSQAEVARALQVSRQSVSRWHRAWQEGGVAALKKAERAGRPPLLSGTELKRVERRLRIPRESERSFRANPNSDSGVFEHLAAGGPGVAAA